MGDDDLRAK